MARPKGFAAWAPKAETLVLIDAVKSVLVEYRDHLPLTVRQIFYRLVGQYDYDKTERAYSRLCEHLVRARRAGMIPFSAIRDDGTVGGGGGGYEGPAEFWQGIAESADYYGRDRLEGQPVAIELWCEAGGMVPQMQRVARPYSIPVYSTGGFSSVTVTHEIAQRALQQERPTVFLHVGDFDPSGESIFEAMGTDAKSFLRSRVYDQADRQGIAGEELESILYLGRAVPEGLPDLVPKRVALTADQVDEYELPTAPPKATDTRSVNWLGDTCQAEAMPPDLLAEVVDEAIRAELDLDVYEDIVEREQEEREDIRSRLAEILEDGS